MRRSILALAFVVVTASCGGGAAQDEPGAPGPRVAVFQDGTFPDARSLVSPAVLGVQLALGQADLAQGVSIMVVETGPDGERATAAAGMVAADPTVVGAVVAPFTRMPADATAALLAAGLPVLSLSELAEAPAHDAGAPWRRLVPPLAIQAGALADVADSLRHNGPACLAGEGTGWSEGLRAEVARRIPGPPSILVGGPADRAGAVAAASGCRVAVWTGSAQGASAFRAGIGRTDGVRLVLADSARTAGFLEAGGPRLAGIDGACSCVDLSTSAEQDAQRFLHDYQAATGLDAGPFAAEGFDAGSLLASALRRAGGPGAGVGAAIASLAGAEGLGGPYRWDPQGDLAPPSVRIYRATGYRWIAIATARFRALAAG